MDGDDTEAVVRNLGDGLDDEECPDKVKDAEKIKNKKSTKVKIVKNIEQKLACKRVGGGGEGGSWCNSPGNLKNIHELRLVLLRLTYPRDKTNQLLEFFYTV